MFALMALILLAVVVWHFLLAVIYSSHRWRREAAINRQLGADHSVLMSIYLRRDVQYFLESGHGFIEFGGLEESVTFEFTPIDIVVWRGGSKPRLMRKIRWDEFEPIQVETLDYGVKAILLQSKSSPPVTAKAFVATGIIGFRQRGLDELKEAIEEIRPVLVVD
jgi:hypothetical protein